MKPEKIFEIKGEDWVKGLSYKSDFPIGGSFAAASKFDPIENYGFFLSSLDSATLGSTTATPIQITSWNDSGTAKLYVHTVDKLYEVLDGTPWTEVNKSAEINVASNFTGAITFKGRYVYSHVAEVRSNVFPVASASDVRILNGAASSEHYHPMCIAPNKLLYVADFGQINEITSVTGTSGNTLGKYLLEDGFVVRDLLNDGNYLVAIADNNTSNKIASAGSLGKYRCQILFYDVNSGRPTADYIYEFNDSWLVSVKQLDGNIYIIGKENMYVCNSATAPRAIFNFGLGSTITEPPLTPFQVTTKDNSIIWCGQTNGAIYAYGSLVSGNKKIFYQPYNIGTTPSAIVWTGTNIYVGGSGANQMLSILNSGTTRTQTSVTTCPLYTSRPYRYAFSKVIMKSKLSSGGEVYLGLNNLDSSGIISDQITKQYSTVGAKQAILFNQENDGSLASSKVFHDFQLTVGSNQAIARVEVWAHPVENYEQTG